MKFSYIDYKCNSDVLDIDYCSRKIWKIENRYKNSGKSFLENFLQDNYLHLQMASTDLDYSIRRRLEFIKRSFCRFL